MGHAPGDSDSVNESQGEVSQPPQQFTTPAANCRDPGLTPSEILHRLQQDRALAAFVDHRAIQPQDVDTYAEQIYRANLELELCGPTSLNAATLLEYNRAIDLGRPHLQRREDR